MNRVKATHLAFPRGLWGCWTGQLRPERWPLVPPARSAMNSPGRIAPGYQPLAARAVPELPERRDDMMSALPVDLEDTRRWQKRTRVKRHHDTTYVHPGGRGWQADRVAPYNPLTSRRVGEWSVRSGTIATFFESGTPTVNAHHTRG